MHDSVDLSSVGKEYFGMCVYMCAYLCVYVYEFLFLAHICMSGGISVSNVLRFGVEVLFCVL